MKIRQALGLAGSIPLAACVLTACSGNVVVDSSAGTTVVSASTASGSAANGTGGAPNTTVVSSAVSGQVTSTGPATVTVGSSTGTMTGGAGLGARCSSDAECGMGGRCMLPTANEPLLGGGPAGGYCTKACTKDADCPGAGSACRQDVNNMNGACLLGCTIGPPIQALDDPLDATKCHGRPDVRCQYYVGVPSVCMPTCGSDIDCPAGRVCDPRSTVCVDTKNVGSPMGEACVLLVPSCAGHCSSFSGGVTMCSSYCSLGGDFVNTTDCGGLDQGACIFTPSGHGAGDWGVCAEACKAHDECLVPAYWCRGINGLTGSITDKGYCVGEPDCKTQADCMNGTCTDTKFGRFCIDLQFPLGTAAP